MNQEPKLYLLDYLIQKYLNHSFFKQSRQPDRILFVIKSLNLAITIPTFKVEALVKEPSKIAIKFYLDILIDSHEKVLSSN